MIPPGTKQCKGCGQFLKHKWFHENRTSRDGYSVRCRACTKKRKQELRAQYKNSQ